MRFFEDVRESVAKIFLSARRYTLDGEEETLGQRTSDEELCTYISAIMTWLILPSNSVSSLIPNLVSYDDFVRESELNGTQVCYQKWFHAQSCVMHLVDKMTADYLFSYYNLLQRNDVQANFKKFLRAHFTPTTHTRDKLEGKPSCLVLNNAQLQKSTFDSWTSENTENICQTLNSWAKQNSRKMLVGMCDWKFVRYFDNGYCGRLEQIYKDLQRLEINTDWSAKRRSFWAQCSHKMQRKNF
jgi:hypothetical protein